MCADEYAHLRHPLLTKLEPPEYDELDDGSSVTEEQKAMLMADARTCFFFMISPLYGNQAPNTCPCFEYIAAALAILCGYFLKKNEKPNYTAAARGLGQPTDNPAQIRKWVEKLKVLERMLDKESSDSDSVADWRRCVAERRRVWETPGARFNDPPDPDYEPEVGRPIEPNSARQRKKRELAELTQQGLYDPVNRRRIEPIGPIYISKKRQSERRAIRVRCEGKTVRGHPCNVHSGCRHADAEPLRRGERFCVHHDPNRVLEGQCEGMTRAGARCRVHKGSRHRDAEPLRRGERFCAHHDVSLQTGVRCAGVRKKRRGQCCVWSAMLHKDAAPLRRGSPFCHHHRVRCAGRTLGGLRCCVTSSSEHAHAQPLRDGAQYCAHHCEPCEPMSLSMCEPCE